MMMKSKYLLIAVYALFSVGGVVCFKFGSNQALECTASNGFFSIRASWLCIVGLLLYVVSFLLYMGLISKFDLSYLVPIITGVVYILTLLSSVAILGEKMQFHQILASLLILAGVVIMNIKK